MVVASRNLKLHISDKAYDVALRIFAPVSQDGSWMCRYELDWPDGTKAVQAGGIDSMQALVCALQMLGSELYATNYHKMGQLALEGQEGGYGIPIAPPLRDMLVGDDKRFV